MAEPLPLKIGITGITGFLGTHLAETARWAGHTVIGYSRNPKPATVPGCSTVRPYVPGQLNVEDLDAMVHLAGESVFSRWSHRKKERILSSRVEGTRAVVDALLRVAPDKRPRVLLTASAIGFYGDTGDAEATEETPPGRGFLAEVTQAWEAEASRAESGGIRVVRLRFGLMLSREGGALRLMRPFFMLGLGATVGDGRQWVSWVHVRDAANLALFALHDERVTGPVNVTAPTPLRNREWTQAIARHWHREARWTVPAPLLRLAMGEAASLVLTSQRVFPRKAVDLGFAFQFPSL